MALTCERARTVVQQFNGKRVIVIGDVMLDRYVRGQVTRVNPEAPVPLLDVEAEQDTTGGAGNVAKNLAALGANAHLISVVGHDLAAQEVLELAKQEGYHLSVVHDERPTIRKVRFLSGSQPLLRVDYEQRHDISPELEEDILKKIEALVQDGVDGLIISDYAKGVVTPRVAKECIQLAQKAGVPLAADVKPSRIQSMRGATFVSPNLKEAREFLGGGDDVATLPYPELAKRIHEQFDTVACITLSAEGMYVYENSECAVHIPQEYKRAVFDISGAGDTAVAVLLLARLAGATYPESAELGNAAGAHVVSQIGTATVSREDLTKMICHTHE